MREIPLSPEVEKHRKGKGPKRERCASYWDEDILRREPRTGTENETGSGTVEGDDKGEDEWVLSDRLPLRAKMGDGFGADLPMEDIRG